MKVTCMSFVAVVCMAFAVGTGWSAETKIAVVDMARLIRAHPETKSNSSMLEKQIEEFELERKEMLAERGKLVKALEEARKEARNRALSEKAREKELEFAEEKLAALRRYEQKIRETAGLRQKQIADQKVRMRRRIVAKLRKIVKGYAEEHGFVLVLDSSGLGMNAVETVVYNLERIDITDSILSTIAEEKQSTAKNALERD